jgi:hypothetical protein
MAVSPTKMALNDIAQKQIPEIIEPNVPDLNQM